MTNTFESANVDNLTAVITGEINGETVEKEFNNPERQRSIMAAVKGLFSAGYSETFESAVNFLRVYVLTRADENDPENLDARIPLTAEEIESLRFSYTQEKFSKGKVKIGDDISPAVTWANVEHKLEVAKAFEMVESAGRAPRKNDPKELILAW